MKTKIVIVAAVAVLICAALSSHAGVWRHVRGVDFEDRYLALDRSPQGLERYREDVLRLHSSVAERGIPDVHSTITFSEPLATGDAQDLLAHFEIETRFMYAFAVDPEGSIVTIGAKPSQELESKLLNAAQNEGAALKGVVSVVGSVQVEHLSELQDDPRVFVVDVSADKNLVRNPENKEYMHHFAWDLYEQSNTRILGGEEN